MRFRGLIALCLLLAALGAAGCLTDKGLVGTEMSLSGEVADAANRHAYRAVERAFDRSLDFHYADPIDHDPKLEVYAPVGPVSPTGYDFELSSYGVETLRGRATCDSGNVAACAAQVVARARAFSQANELCDLCR